jgi:hypothetical protein
MGRFEKLLICLLFTSLFPFGGEAQSLHYTPGPINLDTSRFSHIYFLRDFEDDFPDNYLAVTINDEGGFCVKAKMNHIYRVNTVLTGNTRFRTSINNLNVEISLDLRPGENYYVELGPERTEDNSIIGNMRLLDESEGMSRVKVFPNRVQDRYCLLPGQGGNNDFRENAWEDTVRWHASKKYDYNFRPLPSWELILRSTSRTAFAYRNQLVSKTYSEAGGIIYQSLRKCKSESDFEDFCRTKFPTSTLDTKRDSLTSLEVKPVTIPKGIRYAKIVNVENQHVNKDISDGQPLLIRSTYIVFFWTDRAGKGNTACLYTSERGLPEELHDSSSLEERILWSWQSFRLEEKDQRIKK